MKSYRALVIILIIVNTILIGVCAFFYISKDKVAPKFSFADNSAVYNANIDSEVLLEGITAYDGVDGDVTDRIVIEKIVENVENRTAVVYYAVSDLSGNVEKTSRQFNAIYTTAAPKVEEVVEEVAEATEEAKEDDQDVEESEEETEEVAEEVEEVEEANTEEEEDTAAAETTEVVAPQPVVNATAPVLILKSGSTNVALGQGIAFTEIIKTMTDDKDNYETLFGNIVVSKFDRDKAGSYPVTIYTVDSEGNKSNVCPIVVNVK